MEKEWRSLELLVQKIERTLSRETTIIKSPDFLIDRVTGEKREVDISIQDKIGSTSILIVIECRNRNNTQDVRWIEEIKTKHNDLNASKIIAVSKSGFTKQAKDKAKFYNIELRTFDEITEDIIQQWNSSLEVKIDKISYKVKTVQHVFRGNYNNVTPSVNWATDTFKTLIIKVNGRYLPIDAFIEQDNILNYFKDDTRKKEIGIRVRFDASARMDTNIGELPVLEILITLEALLKKEMVNTKDVNRYRDVLYGKIHEVAYYDVSEQMGQSFKIESYKVVEADKKTKQ